MADRSLARLLLLGLLLGSGCATAHEGRSGTPDAGAPEDGESAPEPALDAGILPCGGECAEGVCDVVSGACVACLSDDDCGAETPLCIENGCVSCAPGDATCEDPEPPPEPPPEDPDPPPDYEPPPEPPPGAMPFGIRFATYNVRTSNLLNSAWGDHNRDFDANDAARMHRVADTIADQSLTVVAAQEIRRPERDAVLGRLRSAHGQEWGHTTQVQGADDTMVLFLRSAWRKIREVHFIIPMQAGLQDRNQIGVLLEHRATGRAVWFYSVHFAAGGDAGAAARAEAARRTVRSIRERAIDNNRPFVLGGDLNTTAGSAVGDIFRAAGFMKNTRSAAERVVNDGCKTFNGRAGTAGLQSCPGGEAVHIDHVWVIRTEMRVEKYQVTANERTSRASDHNPVTTILERR